MAVNEKMIKRSDQLAKVVGTFSGSIDSMSTMLLCLMESQCLQIRAEECDEQDKQNIQLIGGKTTKDYFHPAAADREQPGASALRQSQYEAGVIRDTATAGGVFSNNDSLY
jgi:hypothetical protein